MNSLFVALLISSLLGNFAVVPMSEIIYFHSAVYRAEYHTIVTFATKDDDIPESDMVKARAVLETRLDARNIFDRKIEIDMETKHIKIYFNDKALSTDNIDKFIEEISAKADLTFRDNDGNVLLSGKDIRHSRFFKSEYETEGNNVMLEFTEEGSKRFYEITQKMVGQRLPIYMDETLISSPTVQAPISDGIAVITSLESEKQARELVLQINAGVMPCDLVFNDVCFINADR